MFQNLTRAKKPNMHKSFSLFPVYPSVSGKGHTLRARGKRTPKFPVYFSIRKMLASFEYTERSFHQGTREN